MSEVERLKAERDAAVAQLEQERLGRSFAGSQFIRERITVPAAMMQSTFGKHFAVENGAVLARDAMGNTILARDGSGPASFDEALQTLVEQSGFADRVLTGSGASGSGAVQSAANAGARVMSRSAFEGLSPADRMAHIKGGGTVTD